MASTFEERVRQQHRIAIDELIDAHARSSDQPLVLAVRYRVDDPEDIHLLEVLQGFPGDEDDPLFTTEFERSAQLLIFGKLHLTLASPAQLRTAIARRDPLLEELRKDGKVLYPKSDDHGHAEATSLLEALGMPKS